jgi:hypothetical protein
MYRQSLEELLKWKNSRRRKPLLLQGARQVGKTYIVEQFGKANYKNFIKLNFELQTEIHTIFNDSIEPYKIIERISLYLEKDIDAEHTLLFFDEIQACPRAITSLKYFNENAKEYNIIAAGSLLGVSFVNNQASFPVGKVNFLNLYPMSFYEYLLAIGKEKLAKMAKTNPKQIDETIHQLLMDEFKTFTFVGGMPEAVQEYVDTKDMNEVKNIHQEILMAYERDFVKYTEVAQAIKTKEIWNSIPYQLGKENKKFKFSDVKPKARSINYDSTIEWLKSAGLIHVVSQVRTAKLPLKGYEDASKFKIYLLDTGLLTTMLQVGSSILVRNIELFSAYNGGIIECAICNEIVKNFNTSPHYWVSNSEAEVDFLFQLEDQLIPLEVKSGLDKNTKSLRSYQQINNPPFVMRASPRKYSSTEDGFINIGLYGVMSLGEVI